ncbi:MAG TPA: type II secretion system minor pseudopilin GspK [Casimicrobiaceae bacterium]|nr:type II secretion system minor pseudopilin GspK [Casimicrobiaceae bacterium]
MARAALSRARGAAIILAMLIAALAAAVAATVFAEQQRWSRTVEHRRDQVQAQALVMAGVQWARQVLDDDARHSDIDHLREAWAIPLPPIPLDNGEIRGAIVDAQGRLNINALGGNGTTADLERRRIAALFAQRGGPTAALDAIADWIDADTSVRDTGAEDAYYAGLPVPGLPPDAPVVRVAELVSVKGVTAQSLDAVAPFLSALPADTPVNVNTAPPEVLATIVDGLDGDRLAALVADRAAKPFTSISDFRARLPKGASLASDSTVSVKSGYFYVTVEARQGETIARARALLRRSSGAPTAIAWQVVE